MWLLLLLAASGASSAGLGPRDQTLYVQSGDNISLRLHARPDRVRRLVWTLDSNLVADWTEGRFSDYRNFRGRVSVDNSSGRLEVRGARPGDSGLFQVELNDVVQDLAYKVRVIRRVPRPEVWLQPLGCSRASAVCSLTCDGDTTEAEPVSVSWRAASGDWKQGERRREVRDDSSSTRTFSCRMENPISHQESEPKDNPFFWEDPPQAGGRGWVAVLVVVVVVLVLVLGVLVALAFHFKDHIRSRIFGTGHQIVSQNPPENGTQDPPQNGTGPNQSDGTETTPV